MHKKYSAILDTLLTDTDERWLFNGSRKAIRSCHGSKARRTGNNYAVCTTAAMDDQEIAVRVPAADDADVGIIGIEHQIARLRVVP